MLGVRVASEASESAAVEAVFYGRSSRFPTDVNSRLSNHGELRSRRRAFHSTASTAEQEKRGEERVEFHMSEREFTYCKIEMEKEAEFSPQLLRGGRGNPENFK